MRKALHAAILAAVTLAGCASTQDAYIEAQKAALVREGDARVAEAQAIAAVAVKLDAGGAAAYAVMVANRGAMQGAYQARVERPRDWLDYLEGVARSVSYVANAWTPIASIRASRDVQIAGFNRDIGMAQVQQLGETARIQSVAGIATSIGTAPQPPTTSITVTAGGDSVVGSGTVDRRDCRTIAGTGAQPGGVVQPPTIVLFPGGPGGAATGGC